MLTIGKLGSGQERYYLDKVAEGAEDYYSGEGEAEGQWLGDAARDPGLDAFLASSEVVPISSEATAQRFTTWSLTSAPGRPIRRRRPSGTRRCAGSRATASSTGSLIARVRSAGHRGTGSTSTNGRSST